MRIVIIGAGAVGFDLARKVSQREHDVVVVERDGARLREVEEHLDCRLLEGNGVQASVLLEAGVPDCDLLAAVTDRDEINIVACLTADRLGARTKVARVRQEHYYHQGRLMLAGIDLAINPDLEVVHSVREILFQTAAADFYEFADGRVRVVGARVDAGSAAAGRTLAEITTRFAGRHAIVITLRRNEQTLIPRGDTVVQPDDLVYLAGERAAVDRSLPHFTALAEPLAKAMIVGAGAMGLMLAHDLQDAGVKVKLIDRDEEKCRRAAERLRHTLVLHGDGSDGDLLSSEGVQDMDGFVSLSGDEETNIMACLLARYHGAGKTVCLVNRPDYVPLLPLIGVDAAVSPRLAAAARIARYVRRGAVVSAESLGFSGAEILQFRLQRGCNCLGRPLSRLKDFPRRAVLGAVLKGGRVLTPRGDTVLEASDEVVVFALPEAVDEVEAFFAAD